ncbi:uncharacterized protein LOC124344619 [Daphnia pulicaria]|uniref:uncharacterized protein LOC124344619 n=1 Tax=Daphnia pulicaria TaxID=35523 RepID=UPI001EE9E67E|nr:uncharacterized protein LOC124344619 [Daphnia pulicaria]
MAPESEYFEKTWSNLEKIVKGIVTLGNVSPTAWESGCSHVKFLCKANPTLAWQYYDKTKMCLENQVKSLLIQVNEKRKEETLTEYYKLLQQYTQRITRLDKLYTHLNTNYLWRPKITEPDFLALFEREDFEEEPEERKEILELGINHGLKTNKKYGFSRFFPRRDP